MNNLDDFVIINILNYLDKYTIIKILLSNKYFYNELLPKYLPDIKNFVINDRSLCISCYGKCDVYRSTIIYICDCFDNKYPKQHLRCYHLAKKTRCTTKISKCPFCKKQIMMFFNYN